MAVRKDYAVDSKTVTVAGTPEALTTDEIECTSVYLIAKGTNTGANVYIVDPVTDAKTIPVPAGGITVVITDPRRIRVDVDTSGDIVLWLAM